MFGNSQHLLDFRKDAPTFSVSNLNILKTQRLRLRSVCVCVLKRNILKRNILKRVFSEEVTLPNGKPQEKLRFRDLRGKTLAFKKRIAILSCVLEVSLRRRVCVQVLAFEKRGILPFCVLKPTKFQLENGTHML